MTLARLSTSRSATLSPRLSCSRSPATANTWFAHPPNNYRVYTEQTLQDLDFIQRAQSMGFSLGEIGEILDAQRNKLIDCAEGAKLIEKKMADIKQKIGNLQSIYRYLDEERATLEASAARQLELQRLSNSSNH